MIPAYFLKNPILLFFFSEILYKTENLKKFFCVFLCFFSEMLAICFRMLYNKNDGFVRFQKIYFQEDFHYGISIR